MAFFTKQFCVFSEMSLVQGDDVPLASAVTSNEKFTTTLESPETTTTACSSPTPQDHLLGAGPPPCLSSPPRMTLLSQLQPEEMEKMRALRAFVDSLPIRDGEELLKPCSQADQEKGWFSGLFKSSSDGVPKGSVKWLTWEETYWLQNDLVLLRYLRSYNWDQDIASKQLLQTVWWRRHRQPQLLMPEEVMETAQRGSVYRKGFDVYGRPIIYFRPGREPAQSTKAAQAYTLYTLEKALDSIDKTSGVDQLVFLIDFTGFRISQLPSVDLSKEVVGILNDHYTDILAKAYMLDAPRFFDTAWRLVRMMLHPQTAEKVEFIQTSDKAQLARLLEHIPAEYLEENLGGTSPTTYDHEAYWKAELKHHAAFLDFTSRAVEELKGDKNLASRVMAPGSADSSD